MRTLQEAINQRIAEVGERKTLEARQKKAREGEAAQAFIAWVERKYDVAHDDGCRVVAVEENQPHRSDPVYLIRLFWDDDAVMVRLVPAFRDGRPDYNGDNGGDWHPFYLGHPGPKFDSFLDAMVWCYEQQPATVAVNWTSSTTANVEVR